MRGVNKTDDDQKPGALKVYEADKGAEVEVLEGKMHKSVVCFPRDEADEVEELAKEPVEEVDEEELGKTDREGDERKFG